ncbi:MAG: hypothetical protein MN733_24620 [Nitrososphaera sp.]|nr:hypothetical protein [Nitrososphaera sp.]
MAKLDYLDWFVILEESGGGVSIYGLLPGGRQVNLSHKFDNDRLTAVAERVIYEDNKATEPIIGHEYYPRSMEANALFEGALRPQADRQISFPDKPTSRPQRENPRPHLPISTRVHSQHGAATWQASATNTFHALRLAVIRGVKSYYEWLENHPHRDKIFLSGLGLLVFLITFGLMFLLADQIWWLLEQIMLLFQ